MAFPLVAETGWDRTLAGAGLAIPFARLTADIEQSIDALRPSMEAVCAEFIDAAADALAAFWPGYVDECIASNQSRVEAMSDDELDTLRRAVEAIVNDPSSACRAHIVDLEPQRWPHLLPTEELLQRMHGAEATSTGYSTFRRVSSDEPAPALWFCFDLAAGAIAMPIHSAGLVPPFANIDEEGCRVAYGQTWPEAMDDAAERYSKLAFQFEARLRTLAQARTQHAAQAGRERWDRA